MAKFPRNEKRGPVPHKVLSDRGVHLERVHRESQCGSPKYGKVVVIQHNEDSDDVTAKIGQKCPTCRFRVRGFDHANGAHHKGMVHKHSRR